MFKLSRLCKLDAFFSLLFSQTNTPSHCYHSLDPKNPQSLFIKVHPTIPKLRNYGESRELYFYILKRLPQIKRPFKPKHRIHTMLFNVTLKLQLMHAYWDLNLGTLTPY